MFESNADIYRWVEEVSAQLDHASEQGWGAKFRTALAGATSGEVLGAILSTLNRIRTTPILRKINRGAEGDELIQVLQHLLKLDATNYYVKCSWHRREDIDSWATRIVASLNQLATCDPSFAKGCFLGRSMPSFVAPVRFHLIRPLLEIPPPDIVRKFGYQFSFFFDYRAPEKIQWTLSFGAPKGANGPLSLCTLELPPQKGSSNPLVRRDLMVCLLKSLIESLDPDRAIVRPVELWRSSRSGSSPAEDELPPWMLYVAARIDTVPPNPHVHSRMEVDQGTILLLAEEPISRARPSGILEARAALQALLQLGSRLQ